MIQEIQIGEIIRIDQREYLVVEAPIGGCEKKRPALILLKNVLKGIYRKSYFKHKARREEE